MRLIRRHLSTATHHKKSRRLIVDPGGSAVRSKTVRSCRFYSRPAAKPLRSRPPILRRKVAKVRLAEVRSAEVGPDEVHLHEVRLAEVRPAEVYPAEARLEEGCLAEV